MFLNYLVACSELAYALRQVSSHAQTLSELRCLDDTLPLYKRLEEQQCYNDVWAKYLKTRNCILKEPHSREAYLNVVTKCGIFVDPWYWQDEFKKCTEKFRAQLDTCGSNA